MFVNDFHEVQNGVLSMVDCDNLWQFPFYISGVSGERFRRMQKYIYIYLYLYLYLYMYITPQVC